MSFSALQPQKFLIEVEILSTLLKRYVALRNNAHSEEEQLLIEAEAVTLLEKLLDLDFELKEVQVAQYPNAQEVFGAYGDFEILLTMALIKLRRLTDLFLQHYNINQAQLTALIGKLKRARQKKSALKLWSDSEAKYVLAESFTNFDNLANDLISKTSLSVQATEGILTLPVRAQKVLSIKKASIGQGSNGTPGNSDVEVTTNNTDVLNITKNDPNFWFEYERLDSGPLTLALSVELGKEEIVNSLSLVPINLGTSLGCRVDDILFTTDARTTVSIKDLVSPNLEKTSWEVKSLLEGGWSITFIPVKAKSIVLKLVQDQSYRIPVSTGVSLRERDRYAIGIKSLAVKRITFSREGALNSTEQTLPSGLYVGIPFADVFPPKPDLFDIQIDMSLDHGETWQNLDTLDTGIAKSFLLDGEETGLLWRVNIIRNDTAIQQVTSFLPDTNKLRPTKALLRSVSPAQSPYSFALSDKPHQGKVFALQSKVARRGTRHKRLYVGKGTGTDASISLPLDIASSGLEPEEVHVFVNGREYENNPDNSALTANEWSFSDDFTELEFSSDLPVDARVELVLDEEIMEFELKADGYYHRMELLFDPDKSSIDLESLPRAAAKTSVTLPRDKKLINLGFKNILDDSFQITSKNNSTYTEVTTRAAVQSTANSYYVDYPNGLLWLNSETDNDVLRVSFNHMHGVKASREDYDVVYSEDGITPWGLKIALDKFVSINYTDTVGSGVGKIVDIRTGLYGERATGLSTESKAKALTYNRIVKGTVQVSDDLLNTTEKPEEIEYIDGEAEFYGLLEIEDEKTTSITASGTTADFKLAAGNLWYEDLGVHFSDSTYFGTKVSTLAAVNSAGEYYIDPDGTVTVYVGSGGTLPSGIEISYYYKNPDFDPGNKYSVDYRRGVLYSHKTLKTGGTITYKAANYKVAYDVARTIDDFKYNKTSNSVDVRTEGLHSVNTLVKVLWLQSDEGDSLVDMVDYFSPIISILGFRFT